MAKRATSPPSPPKPTRSYVFTITTTYNDIPLQTFRTLRAARCFSSAFGMNDELFTELQDIMGGGIGDVIGTKIFLFRNGRVVRCWSEDLDWANAACANCPATT